MIAMSREQPHFAVVEQAIGTMRQIQQYIDVGMETTIDVAMDVVENDKENDAQLSELKSVMLDYVGMERDLEQFLAAVEYTKQQATGSGNVSNLEQDLDHKLAELKKPNKPEHLSQHEKYQDLEQKIEELKNPEMGIAKTEPTQGDEDVLMTQESIQTKCPYTGQEMKHPMRNKTCNHNYDREGILEYIKCRGKKAKCPVSGCANTSSLQVSDLEDNRELRRYIERQNRQAGKQPK